MRIEAHIAFWATLLLFPLTMSAKGPSRTPVFKDVYFNALYGFESLDVKTAGINALDNNGSMWGNYYDISFGLLAYRDEHLRIGLESGFKQEHYFYSQAGRQGGIYLNMIPLRVVLDFFHFLQIGVRSDIYLDSRVVSNPVFNYAGFNGDCFNRMSVVPYLATNLQLLPDLGISIKTNFAAIQLFNYDKIDYYNLCDNFLCYPLSFEFGLNWRIFTTGRRKTFNFFIH